MPCAVTERNKANIYCFEKTIQNINFLMVFQDKGSDISCLGVLCII
jgi:hypothetical protein